MARFHFFPFLYIFSVSYLLFATSQASDPGNTSTTSSPHLSETDRAKIWLREYNSSAESVLYKNTVAYWGYATNISDHSQLLSSRADAATAAFNQEAARNASTFNLSLIEDGEIKRLLFKLSRVGIRLNATDNLRMSSLTSNMTNVYSTATICSMNSQNHEIDCSDQWGLYPELTHIMAESTDYEILKYAWVEWRKVTGRPFRDTYQEFVELSNRGARADGFEDTGAWWRFSYDDPQFENQIEKLWYQVLPLYEQLYAYVRKALRKVYGADRIGNVLPAHVLGNMWAQEWSNILHRTIPFPGKQSVDVTQTMLNQNYTPLRMFRLADEFFQSLGLIPLPDSFYELSVLEKPSDRRVVCHPSAWDFYNRKDFRIKMCTRVNMFDLIVIHHELGHVQYYMQFAHQPITFRDGANHGFHEAIGDTIGISVATPKHLHVIGLLENYVPDREQDINFLYKKALEKIAFLPFGYLIDLWRWKVFSGEYTPDRWNEAWWQLRFKYQGLKPPVQRTNDDFDPGAKFHVPANVPYVRYFVACILQFQFYDEMCKAANHTGPLHECDFYQNKAAGEILAKVMRMGSSKPWTDVIQAITGHRHMSAKPLIAYFQPLIDWLKEQNEGDCFGWGYEWPPDVMRTLSPNRCPPEAT